MLFFITLCFVKINCNFTHVIKSTFFQKNLKIKYIAMYDINFCKTGRS